MLFKALQVHDFRQIGTSNALKASQTRQFTSLTQQIELSFLFQMSQIMQPHLLLAEKKPEEEQAGKQPQDEQQFKQITETFVVK